MNERLALWQWAERKLQCGLYEYKARENWMTNGDGKWKSGGMLDSFNGNMRIYFPEIANWDWIDEGRRRERVEKRLFLVQRGIGKMLEEMLV